MGAFPRAFEIKVGSGGLAHQAMRIENKFLRSTLIKAFIALCRIFERYDLGVDNICYVQATVQDSLHQLAIILQHRRLPRMERLRLGPTEAEAQGEAALLCSIIDRAGIFGDIEPRNTDSSRRAGDLHHLVKHNRGLFPAAVTTCFETDGINSAIDFIAPGNLCDHVT